MIKEAELKICKRCNERPVKYYKKRYSNHCIICTSDVQREKEKKLYQLKKSLQPIKHFNTNKNERP